MLLRNKLIFTFILFVMNCTVGAAQDSLLQAYKQQLNKVSEEKKFELLGEISFMYCSTNADSAIKYGDLSLELAKKSGDSLKIAQSCNDLSAAHIVKSDFNKAIAYSEKALRIRRRTGNPGLIMSSLAKLSIGYHQIGKYEDALKAQLESISILEQFGESPNLCKLYGNLSTMYVDIYKNEEALKYAQKAYTLAKKLNIPQLTFSVVNQMISTKGKMDQIDSLEEYFTEAEKLLQEIGSHRLEGSYYDNYAIYLDRKNQPEKALVQYRKALKHALELGNIRSEVFVYLNLAALYNKAENLDSVKYYLERAKPLIEKNNWIDEKLNFYRVSSNFEKLNGNFSKALEFNQLAYDLKDSSLNQSSTNNFSRLQAQFETEKTQKELLQTKANLLQSQAEIEKRNTLLLILFLVLLLVGGAIFSILSRQKARKTQEKQREQFNLLQERVRISRELHDNIGASLTHISSAIASKAFQLNDEPLKADLEAIGTDTRNAIDQLRDSIWAIGTQTLTLSQLTTRIGGFAHKLFENNGAQVKINWAKTTDIDLTPAQGINIYRMCQEALHNAYKYSMCTEINISSTVKTNLFSLHITDNGLGFDPLNSPNGMGLASLKSRAKEIGGEVIIQSEVKKGTQIEIRVPLAIT